MEISYILLLLYIAVVLLIGYISSKKEKREGFLLANRKLGSWSIAFTIAATILGGNMLVNYTGFVYKYGFAILWAILGLVLSFFIMIPMAKKLKEISKQYHFYTMSDYFSKRYGLATGLIVTVIIIIWLLLSAIVQFIAGARIIEAISPVTYVYAILLMSLIVLAYTLMGGFKAVVKTDAFQFLLFGVLLIIVAFGVSQGRTLEFSSIFNIQELGIGKLVAFFIIALTFVFTAPEVWQRVYAGRDNKEISRGLITSSILVAVAILGIGILGLAARASFPDIRPEEAAMMGLTQLLPPPLISIGLVLFFTVIMSTIDTLLFILANNFSEDIWIRFINKKADHLKFTKIGLILFTFLAVIISLAYQDILALALSFLSIGVSFAPIIIGSFYFKLKSKAINLALIAALLSVLILLFAGYITPETSVISLPVSFVFLLIGQAIFKKQRDLFDNSPIIISDK